MMKLPALLNCNYRRDTFGRKEHVPESGTHGTQSIGTAYTVVLDLPDHLLASYGERVAAG